MCHECQRTKPHGGTSNHLSLQTSKFREQAVGTMECVAPWIQLFYCVVLELGYLDEKRSDSSFVWRPTNQQCVVAACHQIELAGYSYCVNDVSYHWIDPIPPLRTVRSVVLKK